MIRFLPLLLTFAVLPALPVSAQSGFPDLRGAEDPLGGADAEAAENSAAQPQELNPAQTNVFALRETINGAEAQTGSSGLGAAGQVEPVRPFSDRIAAVSRAVPVANGGLDESVFGGDTSFDAPRGIRLGAFTLTPELTFTTGWSDNTSRSAAGEPGGFYRIAPDISLTSGWSRHQLDVSLRGSYTGYPDNSDDDDLSGTAAASLRVDVSEATQVTGDLIYSLSREDDSSAEASSGTTYIHSGSASLAATREIGLVAATVSGQIDRTIYTDDDDTESGRDNTLYSANLRLGGNGGGVVSPFAQGSLLLRRFDETCSDSLCEKRDANGYEARAGVTIAAGPKVAGEVSGGWRIENIEDSRLDDLSGLIVNGSLVWSPSRLTTVSAGLGTSFSATDIDNASGSIIYSGDVRLAHAFSDRLVGETGLGYAYRTYEGVEIEERTFAGFGGMTFALTKNTALTANYTHRRFDTSQRGGDYNENAIEAGLRFRH